MVFGGSLLLIAFLLYGGQPITSNVERTVTVKSETGSPAPCPEPAGAGDCGCKEKCPAYIIIQNNTVVTSYDYTGECGQVKYNGVLRLACRFKSAKGEIIESISANPCQ
jgi:hypothetical protein